MNLSLFPEMDKSTAEVPAKEDNHVGAAAKGDVDVLPDGCIKAIVENVIFKNDATGYHVLSILVNGKSETAVGNTIFSADPTGCNFIFQGEWEENSKFRRMQFKFTSCEAAEGELFFFLAYVVKGMGESLARAVLDEFGDETEHVIENLPKLLLRVKGIGEKKLEQIIESWHQLGPIRKISALLKPHGVSNEMVLRVFATLGPESVAKVSDNPYCLTQVQGIGFRRADQVALSMGIAPDAPERIIQCVQFILDKEANDSGDTVLPETQVVMKVLQETADENKKDTVSRSQVKEVIAFMKEEDLVVSYEGGLSLPNLAFYEKRIVEMLKARALLPRIPVPRRNLADAKAMVEDHLGFPLGEEQLAAAELIAEGYRTVAITGSAGTGKSTVTRLFLETYAMECNRDDIICIALAAMAADKCRQLSGFEAGTIHSTLKLNTEDGYNADNPLPYKIVVLDEASMINTWLFYKVLSAIGPDTILLLLGDVAQLPPIGAGDVFADIIRYRLCPVAWLRKIHRQADNSVLLYNANVVKEGRVPERYRANCFNDFWFIDKTPGWHKNSRYMSPKDVEPLREENNQLILDYIRRCCERLKPSLKDIIRDYQVLTPVHKGALGTQSLNKAIQGVMNPAAGQGEFERFGVVFREGDKVVHLQNQKMRIVSGINTYQQQGRYVEFKDESKVFNGSVGIIEYVDRGTGTMHVIYPLLDLVVCYELLQLKEAIIDLAYAITVHKAQGSEYRTCIIPITSAAYRMLTTNWLYTAITRAREKVLLVGHAQMFERACTNIVETKRKTVIQEILKMAA